MVINLNLLAATAESFVFVMMQRCVMFNTFIIVVKLNLLAATAGHPSL